MKPATLFILLAFVSTAIAADLELPLRTKLGEAIFAERFQPARIEKMLSRNLSDELARLEKGPASDYVAKIRKILSDVSQDVAASTSFKDEYSGWLATYLSKGELQTYLDFLRSDVGKKVSDLDDRALPLFEEAIQRRSKGRLESIPLLLAEARSK